VLRFFSFPAVLRKSLRMLETRISILAAPTKLRLFPLSLFCHLGTIHRLVTIERLSWGYDYIASVISLSAKAGFFTYLFSHDSWS